MTEAIALSIVLGLWLAALLVWQIAATRADRAERQVLRIRMHRGLTRDEARVFLSALTGLRPPAWRRWFDTPVVTLEVTANAGEIEHRIILADRLLRRVQAALRANLPAVRVEQVEYTEPSVTAAVEYRLTSGHRSLQVDDAVSRLLLTSMATVSGKESVTVQWLITPGSPPALPRVQDTPGGWQSVLGRPAGAMTSTADVAAAKRKLEHPVLLGVLRIGVSTSATGSSLHLLRQVESALHPATAPGVHIRRRILPKGLVARRVRGRIAPLVSWPMPVNTEELAGLIGWPFGTHAVPGLSMSGCRPLPVTAIVPTIGTVIGDGYTDGRPRPVAVDLDARLRHLFLLGGTGSGKSTVMTNMAIQDATAGRSVLIIDPKADLIDGFLGSLDPAHHDRVVVLDPSDATRPVGIDPLNRRAGNPELAVEQFTSVMHRIYAANWGVRTDDCLRAGLRTLILDPRATIAELPGLFTSPAIRRIFVDRVTDPTLTQFWRWYGGLSDAEAATVVAPLLNKLRALLGRPALRRAFCQPTPIFDLADQLDHGGIVVVSLNSGVIGEDAANLFASLLMGQLWDTIQRRALQPVGHRHPTMVFLDELHRYVALPLPLEELLAQARSYGVGITAAAQHLGQLGPDLRRTMLATPRSRVAFQAHGEDATVLARTFGLGLTAEDLQGLDAYEVVTQVHAGGRTQPAATTTTRPAPPTIGDARQVRARSRKQWGADGDAIDAAITERIDQSSPSKGGPDVPTGRKRRQS